MRVRMGLAAAAVVAGSLGIATPAQAGCVGTQNTAGVCTEVGVLYSDCVYLGGPQCTWVYVLGPRVTACWLGNPSLITCG
jgi:hypothetical protein